MFQTHGNGKAFPGLGSEECSREGPRETLKPSPGPSRDVNDEWLITS